MPARGGLLVALLGAALLGPACRSTPAPAPGAESAAALDDHARHVEAGFREALPWLAPRLERAVARAVFVQVEEVGVDCAHAGRLFVGDGPGVAVRLTCRHDRPPPPGGRAFRMLVGIEDAADLERLRTEGLELADRPHVDTTPGSGAPADDAGVWVVTTARGGLLYPAHELTQRLTVEPGPDAPRP